MVSNESKNNENIFKTLCLVLIVLIITAGVLVVYLLKTEMITFGPVNSSPKVEIKHTEVSTTVKEGIYITDVSEIVDETMPAIVAITSKTLIQSGIFGGFFGNQDYYQEGAGSGIIISQSDDELFILTNNHVVSNASELTVQFIDGKSVDATIKGTSQRKDVAVISIKTKNIDKSTLEQIKIATLGSSDDLKVGNGIIAIGNALGYGQSVTTGVISALNRTISGDNYENKMIQIDAAINGGNSGGALLNSRGEVVGINSAKYSSNGYSSSASIEGMGFAIPISEVEELINSLMAGKGENKGMTLGIEGYMTNSNLGIPDGFYISKITSDGNASKSELEIGNVIVEVDGKKVETAETISNVLYSKKSGDSIKLKIKYISNREYKEKEITIELK